MRQPASSDEEWMVGPSVVRGCGQPGPPGGQRRRVQEGEQAPVVRVCRQTTPRRAGRAAGNFALTFTV